LEAKLHPGEVQLFTARSSSGHPPEVVWSVQEGDGGGRIDRTGIYTAPANAGIFHVVATDRVTGKASAAATVTVRA